MIPILWLRKWNSRLVKKLDPNHTARKQQNGNLNLGKPISKTWLHVHSTIRLSNSFMFQVRKLQPTVFKSCPKLGKVNDDEKGIEDCLIAKPT